MSSAILYLAIVAIWACFLVPAWVRRPHARSDRSAETAPDDWFAAEADDEHYYGQSGLAMPDVRTQEAGPETEHYYPTNTENDYEAGHEYDVHAGFGHHQEYGDQPEPYHTAWMPPSREPILRARRRMLTILVTMTAATGAFAYLGLVGWWICVPPAGMLMFYVLLLREVALADAERARKRHALALREARAAAAAAREHTYQARAERGAGVGDQGGAEPTAQIIDISGRVGDQLYDQYADAAVRAVGD